MARLDRTLGKAVQTALRLVYPPRCLGCGGLVESDFGLCGACWRDTPFITGLVCDCCGAPLPGGREGEVARCDDCIANPPPWQMGRSAMVYDGMGRQLVLALKHGSRLDIAEPAADWLAEAGAPLIEPGMIVAPIPLHWRRRVSRGYNQSALLSRGLARRLKLLEALDLPDLLERRHATPTLGRKNREERFAALSGRISVNQRHREALQGRPVLLIDDVLTTGATFSAATEACRMAGSGTVSVLALARATKDA